MTKHQAKSKRKSPFLPLRASICVSFSLELRLVATVASLRSRVRRTLYELICRRSSCQKYWRDVNEKCIKEDTEAH